MAACYPGFLKIAAAASVDSQRGRAVEGHAEPTPGVAGLNRVGIDLSGARGPQVRVLVPIAANKAAYKLSESRDAMNTIRRYGADDAHVILCIQLNAAGQVEPQLKSRAAMEPVQQVARDHALHHLQHRRDQFRLRRQQHAQRDR